MRREPCQGWNIRPFPVRQPELYILYEKETMAAMEKDMTKGSPFRLILAFTVPLIIGNVFQQLYNMVDAIIVGRTVGVNALAAVGMSGSIVFLILGFLN